MSGYIDRGEHRFEKSGILDDCKIQGADES